jgi:hypothetical protein
MVGTILTCCVGSRSFFPNLPKGFTKVMIANGHAKPMTHPQLSSSTLISDGNELQKNKKGVIFENLWNGSLVYSTIDNVQINKHGTIWKSQIEKGSECIDVNGFVNANYFRWRDDVWNSNYPLCFKENDEPLFAMITKENDEKSYERLSIYDARKNFYINDYCRLVRKTQDYNEILKLVINGNNVCIFDYNLPTDKIKGKSRELCQNIYMKINTKSLYQCVNDVKNVKVSSGLALAFCLIDDIKRKNMSIEEYGVEINVENEVIKKLQPLLPLRPFDKLSFDDIENKGQDYLLKGHHIKDQREKKIKKGYMNYMNKHQNNIDTNHREEASYLSHKNDDVNENLKIKWLKMNDQHIKRLALAYNISYERYDKNMIINKIIDKITL